MTELTPALTALRDIADPKAVIDEADVDAYLTEWRGRWKGHSPLILAPATTEELSQLMTHADAHDIAVVPQGGNTGLVGAQVPNGEVLISMKRMRRIRSVSADDFAMTVEAGLTLAEAQQAAADVGRLFPLSIGSEGTCQVGGILSTNAGGVNVLRYGNARDLVLGIEAVLPDGRIWNGLNSLRKNNVGYDLKHLFVGGEGTLGIITAATLKLFPQPKERLTCFVAFPSSQAAIDLLSHAQTASGGMVMSFELMNAASYELVLNAFPQLQRPVETSAPCYGLVEFAAGQIGVVQSLAETVLEQALTDGFVIDGVIAQNQTQAEEIWTLRHNASAAMKADPMYCVKCDVSVPIRQVPSFLEEANKAVLHEVPGTRIIAFGHVGDGNIHYDLLGPTDLDNDKWTERSAPLEHLVHDIVVAHGGSISAEHGIGQLKRDELATRKDPTEMAMMHAIKQALDPKGLMNPNKLLSSE